MEIKDILYRSFYVKFSCYSPFIVYKIHPFQGVQGLIKYGELKDILGKDMCKKLKNMVRHQRFKFYSPPTNVEVSDLLKVCVRVCFLYIFLPSS